MLDACEKAGIPAGIEEPCRRGDVRYWRYEKQADERREGAAGRFELCTVAPIFICYANKNRAGEQENS